MDKHMRQMQTTSTNRNIDPFLSGFNYGQNDDDFYLNIYEQFLMDNNQTKQTDSSSDWDSDESIEESEEESSECSNLCHEEPLEVKQLISFCQNVPKLLPHICELSENDPIINEEMEAIEKESVHMDLLTCSAATTNCYRDSSKVIIRSKYGKWSCNGRFDPDIGLGPLSHLFRDGIANETQIFQQNINQFQQNYDICGDYNNRFENSFAIKDLSEGFVDSFNHQMLYHDLNQQNQSISQFNGETQSHNHFTPIETNSSDKCFVSTQLVSECVPQMYSSNQFNQNYVFTNDCYTYDPNPIQNVYY